MQTLQRCALCEKVVRTMSSRLMIITVYYMSTTQSDYILGNVTFIQDIILAVTQTTAKPVVATWLQQF